MKRFTDTFRESTTPKCVVAALLLYFYKFAISGTMAWGVEQPAFDPLAFAAGASIILAPWVHREWRKSRYKDE